MMHSQPSSGGGGQVDIDLKISQGVMTGNKTGTQTLTKATLNCIFLF